MDSTGKGIQGRPLILYDGIVFGLQPHGGISVYFGELLKRATALEAELQLLIYQDNAVSAEMVFPGKLIKGSSRIGERYRDILVSDYVTLAHSSYYRIARGSQVLNVVTVHDFTYERFRSGAALLLHSWQKNHAIRRADAVICISRNTREDLLEFVPDVDSGKIHVVPQAASDIFQPIIGGPANITLPFVLFIGDRRAYKNFLPAVRAVQRVPGLCLWIVGGGALQTEEKKTLDRFLPGRYEHKGFVSEQQLNTFYNQAHALLYPSSYEGFGIPVLEAMRAGCPVVALNASSIPEVAGNAAYLVETPDPELFAIALRSLFEPTNRLSLRDRGIAQAELFSWEQTFRQTVSVYEKLLGKRLIYD